MTDQIDQPHTSVTCTICSTLADQEFASQKFGWEENDTYLPAAALKLNAVRKLRPFDSRELELQQCPECGTCYLLKTDYEYLVNGSEDWQSLIRLNPAEAAEYRVAPIADNET